LNGQISHGNINLTWRARYFVPNWYHCHMFRQGVTVVTRLGIEGFPDIYDLQTCLNGQSDSNFSWIILVRPSAHTQIRELRQELQRTSSLFTHTKIQKVNSDSRGGILNLALKFCEDGMIVVLDDDDIPLPNFIETINHFGKLTSMSSILRTLTFSQETHRFGGLVGNHQISTSKGLELWPRNFNLLSHIENNQSPFMSLSFPVRKLREYDLRWDPSLTAVEDWDFLIRAAENIPVESIPKVTSLYRRSNGAYRSQEVTTRKEWRESEERVRTKIQKLELRIRIQDLIEDPHWTSSNIGFHQEELPNWYRRLVKMFLPIANRFPRLYIILRKIHNKFISLIKAHTS
jgi:hypothetical protein